MAEATLQNDGDLYEITANATLSLGQVVQLRDGRAGFANTSITSGDPGEIQVTGTIRITKTANIVILEGGEVYWDHSANAAHYKPVNDRDFFVGACVEDASSTATFVDVALNQRPRWNIDVFRDPVLTVPVGTQGLNTMGVFRRGGSATYLLSSTSEAQKMDILSVDGFNKDGNAIIEAIFTVPSDGAGTVVDVSLGIANGTHATDADSISEHLFLHLDANNTAINLQSKDGSTTVAATDTTKTYTEGAAVANRVYFWADMRDPADVQCYINGVLVLDGSTFNINAVASTLFLLAHIEKSSAADAYEFSLHALRCRLCEQ